MRMFLAALLVVPLTLSAQLTVTPVTAVPYVPGQSFGPLAPIPDPAYDAELLAYGAAYLGFLSVPGVAMPLASGFAPLSPQWDPTQGDPTLVPMDVDPLGDGLILFEEIFAHRLQLDPSQGALFNVGDLIQSDFWVQQQWRHWVGTRQLVTADFMDPVAHQNHLQALLEAITVGFDWGTRGVPYFDGGLSFLVSDRTNKKKGNPAPVPVPVPVGGLPPAVQNCDTHLRGLAGTLAGFGGLYDSDGTWWFSHKGFDCDDFADAIGSRIIKGQAGMTACTIRVIWTMPNGGTARHRVTKIKCGGHYWIVDGQTGAVSGPHANGTKADARPVLGGYNVDNTKPVRTIDDGRSLGTRGGLREPPAWFNCPQQRQRFQNITGLDPACFF